MLSEVSAATEVAEQPASRSRAGPLPNGHRDPIRPGGELHARLPATSVPGDDRDLAGAGRQGGHAAEKAVAESGTTEQGAVESADVAAGALQVDLAEPDKSMRPAVMCPSSCPNQR